VRCGAPVVEATTAPGGFSPGLAARIVCGDGRRWFVKAASGQVNPRYPTPAPARSQDPR